MTLKPIVAIALVPLFLAACGPGNKQGTGTILGAVAGGAAGAAIGGRDNRIPGVAIGAMAGGILGNLCGGAGGDMFLRRTGLGRPMFLFVILLVLAPVNIAYRLVDGDSIWFWIGVFAGFFQLGCFYGPTFSTVQELAPVKIRATVVAFLILTLNFVGLGVGVTAGGYTVDVMIERGWFDDSFVRRWTSGPLLVRIDTGRLLRADALAGGGRLPEFPHRGPPLPGPVARPAVQP